MQKVVVAVVATVSAAFAACFPSSISQAQSPPLVPDKPDAIAIDPDAIANPQDLPAIGKWMIDPNGTVAHWLGQMVDGKRLYEPVNVILIDPFATSADDARARLLKAMALAGYPVRFGHSAGYRGLIGGTFFPQMPAERDDAFSNRIFEESNNHGRVFGPRPLPSGGFIFIAAFSRERIDLLDWPGHRYASFKAARDDLAVRLVADAGFRAGKPVPLNNAIADDPDVTTGDHDGDAVLLRADK